MAVGIHGTSESIASVSGFQAQRLPTLPAVPRPFALASLVLALTVSACASSRPSESFDGALLPAGLRARDFTLTALNGGHALTAPTGGHALTTPTGGHRKHVSLHDFQGDVVLLAFLSSSQRSSQLAAQQIRGALDKLGSRAGRAVATLIVSADARARRNDVESLLRETSLQGRALYLTGPAQRLRSIWKAYGVVPASAGEQAFLASTPIVLVDRAGVERVGFPVEQLTPEGLAHDLRMLLAR